MLDCRNQRSRYDVVMITIRGARLPFDKGDSVKECFTLPGLPKQIGTIIRVESFYSTVVYVVNIRTRGRIASSPGSSNTFNSRSKWRRRDYFDKVSPEELELHKGAHHSHPIFVACPQQVQLAIRVRPSREIHHFEINAGRY